MEIPGSISSQRDFAFVSALIDSSPTYPPRLETRNTPGTFFYFFIQHGMDNQRQPDTLARSSALVSALFAAWTPQPEARIRDAG